MVLIDFWTYSCINCQRALPHVEAWYNDYKNDGLVVVGVSTPEFAFEHVVSNVKSAANHLGIGYPVAVDNNYGTWDAYNNNYWPAEYLIDPKGQVRAYDFGEGGYSDMENNIRNLLTADGVKKLPGLAPMWPTRPRPARPTPESYLGYSEVTSDEIHRRDVTGRQQGHGVPRPLVHPFQQSRLRRHLDRPEAGRFRRRRRFHPFELHGRRGRLPRHRRDRQGGRVSVNGKLLKTITIAGVPTLYTVISGSELATGNLTLTFTPGVQAYDFTFWVILS